MSSTWTLLKPLTLTIYNSILLEKLSSYGLDRWWFGVILGSAGLMAVLHDLKGLFQ